MSQENTIMGHVSVYASTSVGSSPKDPIAIVAAKEFAKDVTAIKQPSEMTTAQLKSEARATLKAVETALPRLLELEEIFNKRWREFGPTRDLACNEMFGCSLKSMRDKRNYWKDKLSLPEESGNETPTETLAKVNALKPLPPAYTTADIDADLVASLKPKEPEERPAVHAGPAPRPEPVPEKKPRERNIYLAGGLFHLGLFVVLILGTAHMLAWKSLLGFGWPTLPLPIVDFLAAGAIVSMIALFINRLVNPVLKLISGPAEWLNLLFVFLPMVTGYMMTHHLWFAYEVLFSLHMIAVDVLLIWIPLSRISHFMFYFFSKAIHGADFGKRAVTP